MTGLLAVVRHELRERRSLILAVPVLALLPLVSPYLPVLSAMARGRGAHGVRDVDRFRPALGAGSRPGGFGPGRGGRGPEAGVLLLPALERVCDLGREDGGGPAPSPDGVDPGLRPLGSRASRRFGGALDPLALQPRRGARPGGPGPRRGDAVPHAVHLSGPGPGPRRPLPGRLLPPGSPPHRRGRRPRAPDLRTQSWDRPLLDGGDRRRVPLHALPGGRLRARCGRSQRPAERPSRAVAHALRWSRPGLRRRCGLRGLAPEPVARAPHASQGARPWPTGRTFSSRDSAPGQPGPRPRSWSTLATGREADHPGNHRSRVLAPAPGTCSSSRASSIRAWS